MQEQLENHPAIEAIKVANEIQYQKRLKQKAISANVEARKQAKLRGDNTYLGTPCNKEGHGAVRKTYNGICRDCHRLWNVEYRARAKAELAELRAAVYGKEATDN